tara:strand:+ start:89 stop:616 length:528 start_codon:yes stop_codon:yes gene_type:complete
MPNYIKPTITVTANKNSITTGNAGPLSVALSLSGTDLLTVDNVQSEIKSLVDTPVQLLDGSALSGGTETPSTAAANQVGGFLYIKNTGTAKAAYVGIVSNVIENDGSTVLGNDAPTAPGATGAGHLAEVANTTLRTMTLRPGEFAWFPWDYTGDLYAECEHSDGTSLEYWLFDRG